MSKEKNNITIKILALLISIILWSYVMGLENPEQDRIYKNVAVTLSNAAALDRQGLVVMDPKEFTVNVRVLGKKSDFDDDKFGAKNIVAQVDLSGYNEGQVKVGINVSLKDASSNIKVISHEPKEILFTFDKLITEEKTVTIQTSGELPNGYILGDISSKPQSILLNGPRSWINEVANVIAVVNIAGKTSDINDSFPIKIVDSQRNDVRGVDKNPSLIDIKIPVYRTTSVPIELITENELPENFAITNISILPRALAIKGNKDIVNISSINTKPIDINLLLNHSSMEVELDLPTGVELVDPKEKVIISYAIEETIIMDYNIIMKDIEIKNLDPSLSINSADLDSVIQISLKGIKSILEGITEEDLKLEIDLAGLEEGKHNVELKILNIQGITVEEIKPEPISIRLVSD